MHLNAVSDLLHSRSFALGLAFGGFALLLAASIAASSRRKLPDVAGIAFVAAAWLGVRGAWGIELARGGVVLAFAVLALGGAIGAVACAHSAWGREFPLFTTAVAVTPGAIILAATSPFMTSSTGRILLAVSTIG